MNKFFYLKLSSLVAFMCIPMMIFSQDIHYSNFGFSPLNTNPALTGLFPGDVRLNGSYRSQWQGVPVSYSTYTLGADMRLGDDAKNPNRPWSVGAIVNYDQAGWSRLNNLSAGLSGAYKLPIDKANFLSIGLMGGFGQRRFQTDDLTWDDQFREKQFDPNFISTDNATFNRTHTYLDASTGLNFHHQKPGKRTSFDLGVGYFHFNNPNKSFIDDPKVGLESRYNLYAGGNIQLTRLFDLMVEGVFQYQGPHREFVGNLGGRIYLVDKKTKQIALQLGISLRGADAFSPHVGLIYNNWRASLNFDTNYSNFQTASNKLGGPEVSVIYIFGKVPPGQYCPVCPTYL